MNRFLATIRTDVRLQYRNGFYFAVAFVLLMIAILLTQLPKIDWDPWLPAVVFGNLVMVPFYFVGGLVLLEKGEGTLEAQVVTPLRVEEYLGAKVVTLGALSLFENIAVVTMANGLEYRALPLVIGILFSAAIYALLGFIIVARYDSVNEYIMPSTLYVFGLCLPYLSYFDIWTSWLMFLHPLQGPLLAMKAAFTPVEFRELAVGLVTSTAWLVIICVLSKRAFRRFVVRKEGVR